MAPSLAELLLAVVGLFIAGVVKGATGLGYTTCALPFLVFGIGLSPAMALVSIPAMATNISLALTTGHVRDTVRRFWPLYAAMLPGVAAGLALLTLLDQRTASRALGCVIVAYVALAMTKPNLTLPARLETPLSVPAGFCNGLIAGLTGSQVMPLLPYVMALRLEAARMIQAINLAVLIASLALAVGLATTGILSATIFVAATIGTIPALVGVELGARARTKIPVERLRDLVLLTLLVIGIVMLLR